MNDPLTSAQRAATSIRWKIHLRSPRDEVYALVATPEGRARFWAESAEEIDGAVRFVFRDGTGWTSPVLDRVEPRLFRISYFEGSVATFELERAAAGTTELTLTESGVPADGFADNHAGWISVLLNLKAVADHGIDLRNGDPARNWIAGYVDV